MGKKPCCAGRPVRKLSIKGLQVGIGNLDDILKEVAELGLADEEAIRRELLKRAKVYNYVPEAAEKDYAEALLEVWRRQYEGKI